MKNKPNFFIIGTPKCGTTSLCFYLSKHNDVFISDPKEPRYFSPDFPEKHRRIKTKEEYEKIFDKATGYKAIGEASAYYLFSKIAVQNIINFNPRAKFIVLGKKPLDVARSWHNHLVHNGYENITNFEKAFEIDNNKSSLSYKQIMKWENRVNIVRKIIPKKNLIIFKIDEESMENIYSKTLNFINVKHDGRKYFPIVNKGKSTSYLRMVIFNIKRIYRKYILKR